jgi:hypothetical protein
MTARNKRDGFFVVHCHARERYANIFCRFKRIGLSARAFGVYVNKAHLNRRKRAVQIIMRRPVISEPFFLRAPEYIVLRFPNVFAPARKPD